MEQKSIDQSPRIENRFRVTISLVDMQLDNENMMLEAYAVGCTDRVHAQHFYDALQRLLQIVTYKPVA